MNKFALVAAVAVFALSPLAAIAADKPSAEQCDAWLAKADTNNDGTIGNNEDAKKYVEMITKGGMTGMGEDETVPKAMFIEQCLKGSFGMPTG